MLIDDLADKIWANPRFQSDYEALLLRSISDGVGLPPTPRGDDWRESLRRLLQSATHFAGTQTLVYRQAAYRIATAAVRLYGADYSNAKDVAVLVLGRLGNFPAVQLLNRHHEISYTELPLPLWFEIECRETNNSVRANGHTEILTDFQKRLWDSLSSRVSTAVTAPTSAGKSFALQKFLARLSLTDPGWAVYIVPTRALLNQVSDTLRDLLGSLGLADRVFTIPVPPSELNATTGIYVVTQERLQLLLEADPSLAFGLVIVDEAQVLADGGRGVILEVVIEKLRARRQGIQFLFGSPQTKNPGVFQGVFGLPELNVVEELEAPVAQNILFVDTDPIKLNEADLSVLLGGGRQHLGRLALPSSLYDSDQKLSLVSWFLGKGSKSIVYAGGQARCELVADQIMQLVRSEDGSPQADAEIVELSKFLREHIHPQFLLAESVLHKVGFHYGNMPPVVRKNVENFFSTGALDYLVCTSTLLHGVNLPARNLFLLDPTKGVDWDTREEIPISSLEFWNLSGRAGRLGKEFEGNVFLIDEQKWQSRPLDGDKQQEIEAATQKTLKENVGEFIAFVKNPEHKSGDRPADENTFVKLFIDLKRGALSESLDRILGSRTQ